MRAINIAFFSRDMAERSESEVSAAIMEAGRKLGNELKER